MFDPDSFNGNFVLNVCCKCHREWECYRIESEFVCDDCDDTPPADGPDHRDGDDQ